MSARSQASAVRTLLAEAVAAWEGGDAALAESRCRHALAHDAEDVAALLLLGVVLRQRDPAAAYIALAAAAERDPRNANAWFHLGNLHREQQRFAAAVAAYESATALAPSHAGLHNNLGLALEGAGDPERAAAAYRAALAAQPGHRQALGNLAHLLCRLHRYTEAARLCEDYLRRHADADATVWTDHGICAQHVRDLDTARTSLERARRLAPNDALILVNLGSVQVARGDYETAQKVLAQATALEPSLLYASSLLAYCQAQLGNWTGLSARHESIRRALEAGSDQPLNAFAALALPLSAALQLRVARRWARDLAPPAPLARPGPGIRRGATLRLGYVSSDFRTHATAALLCEVWERHDRGRLTTHAYCVTPREHSALRRRIESAFDHFVDCAEDAIEQTARRIAQDGIEVLIDLNGYTTHARSEIFALRAAPVQVSWLGYLGTLGAHWYDYVLTDRFVAPPSQQAFFTERLLYLPDCYCPSDTRRPVASLEADRAACGLPADGVVFCCFNNSYKILPPVFDIWMRLLAAVPGSVLWLSPGQATACANLRREARVRGVDPARLVFAPRVSLPEHLARHAHADLFLDTTPYNAGATANDALFMGVPVLTCAGDTMASRVAGSQLTAIGLPELITTNLADYEALALTLGRDRTLLGQYRARLAANRHTAPLFDMARFTRALDDLLLAAWENRPSSPPPA
jgi:predicted O-linked N-acetylglucosamine transferase (SPINDLY family)